VVEVSVVEVSVKAEGAEVMTKEVEEQVVVLAQVGAQVEGSEPVAGGRDSSKLEDSGEMEEVRKCHKAEAESCICHKEAAMESCICHREAAPADCICHKEAAPADCICRKVVEKGARICRKAAEAAEASHKESD